MPGTTWHGATGRSATASTALNCLRSSTPSAGEDLAKGIELTSLELADRLSVSGSPADCAAKIRDEIAPSGVNHMVLAITDRSLVKAFTGMDIEVVADVNTQLQLIHDEVIPAV
jgi:5,10-methylenetetrahydromethanopterin reductase